MGKIFVTAAAMTAALFLAAGTVSAQEKQKVEKKVTIVTVDDKGVKKDTTIVTTGTVTAGDEEFIFHMEDGKVIHGTGRGNRMVFISRDPDEPDTPIMRHMKVMNLDAEPKEGVSYSISIDGVTVNIRAPKEKAKEADLILAEVKKILEIK
jgi:hypothetical protein